METEQNCNILTPHSYGHKSISFPFSWAAQPGAGGPASLGYGPHSSIFSPTLIAQSGVMRARLQGAGSLYRILSPTNSNFLCTELYHCFTPTQFNLSTVKVIPLIPSTGCTCYLHRCISYFDSSGGVNMQQFSKAFTKIHGVIIIFLNGAYITKFPVFLSLSLSLSLSLPLAIHHRTFRWHPVSVQSWCP